MSDLPKFSGTERFIIELLAAQDELFGLRMVELSGGRLKRGTVYVTLGRMLEKGLSRIAAGAAAGRRDRLPRRLYRPTGLAMRVLAAWRRPKPRISPARNRRRRDGSRNARARIRIAVVRPGHGASHL